ncbi:MAG: 50S ribosomal protein L29 [Parcubacteria group bacterium GW2011_GWB1_46_8]|nr:MAG: 50S ribosomal protein L29 [Parcubacteria group bacterium GW2011_GWA1_45_7]KKU11071.1 MAG: 50S ribosomal protein L29 [Parcubacteria group bacterium GW2011_GWF1_45_5]KKU44108.1 MAG: 50S ribosomal protein L29 [Parcubacteria group bacterium GW2011_GWA2_46_7]KKU46667.1 MAG: 50S ribosomal protein L29 [Parcubacteria group bacterium GW2011_GWB1_46_8]KKU47155.1 MAG: 50S ribosomal protein L29 [Parcubacteria group bacterium GW2011_GWF2_46_8]
MKIRDIKQKTEKELKDAHAQLTIKLRSLRFDLKLAKLQSTHVIRQTKQDIARVLTVLQEKHGSSETKTE